MPLPLLDHFDLLAPYYDRIFQGGRFVRRDIDRLVSFVAPESSHRLLDIGGGTGRISRHFCEHVAQVYVLDPSPGMLQQGQRKGIGLLTVCPRTLWPTQGESERLPFVEGAFDRIIVIDAFHHLCDQVVAAAEMVRVLAPGGRLVIQEPDIAHWGVKMVALGEKALLMRSRFYAPEAIRAIFYPCDEVANVRIEPRSESAPGVTAWVIVDKR